MNGEVMGQKKNAVISQLVTNKKIGIVKLKPCFINLPELLILDEPF